jgi:pimeloyl-ACP methyl ester carboxylesterase
MPGAPRDATPIIRENPDEVGRAATLVRKAVTATAPHIAFADVGVGDPAVVLLHGLFANRTYYAAQARHLAARHRVLTIDLRGHGESDVPEEGYRLDALADDVIRVCEEARVSHAVFGGHSMPVALKVALRRPDLAAGLVLLDGAVLLPPAVRDGRLGPLIRALETDAWRDALIAFFGSVAGSAAERVRRDLATVPRVYAAPLLRDIVSSDFSAELVAVHCPLTYVHGEMPLDLERLRALRPDAIVKTIPDAGHCLMLTAPDEVNAALGRFLTAVA